MEEKTFIVRKHISYMCRKKGIGILGEISHGKAESSAGKELFGRVPNICRIFES